MFAQFMGDSEETEIPIPGGPDDGLANSVKDRLLSGHLDWSFKNGNVGP